MNTPHMLARMSDVTPRGYTPTPRPRPVQVPASNSESRKRAERKAEPTYGMCLACRSVEVALVRATGTRDLSHMGEHPAYPTGYGCEVCA